MENNQPDKQSATKIIDKALQRIKQLPRKPLLIIGIVILAVGLMFGIYKIGFNRGHNAGKAQAKKEQQAINALNLPFGQSPLNIISGKISDIDDDSIKLDTSTGKKETIRINDATKITKKGKPLDKSSLKTGQKIAIFPKETHNLTAIRIVVLD